MVLNRRFVVYYRRNHRLSRRLSGPFAQELSAFGRLLDPIADKLLVVSALMIIVANGLVDNISYIPVVVILCREILVSGLREFLSEVRVGLPVTRLAKWKTGFQMTALSVLLMSPAKFFNVIEGFWVGLGTVCLWVAGVLTFITGYQYFEKSLAYIKSVEKKGPRNGCRQKKRSQNRTPTGCQKSRSGQGKVKNCGQKQKNGSQKNGFRQKSSAKGCRRQIRIR